jgi:DNA-3-methyladenine glycosylase II
LAARHWTSCASRIDSEQVTPSPDPPLPALLRTPDDVARGACELARLDPRWHAVLARTGPPPLRQRAPGFAGLAEIVVGQQVSTASAAAIYARLAKRIQPLEATRVKRTRVATLQACGLSMPKIRTLHAVAGAIVAGELDLATLGDRPADEAHAALTAVHGIGPWTADIYLLFCLGHPDAWPAGDLALQEAARIAFDLPARPGTKAMGPLAEGWRPWRGVAAKALWAFYHVVKGRAGVAE